MSWAGGNNPVYALALKVAELEREYLVVGGGGGPTPATMQQQQGKTSILELPTTEPKSSFTISPTNKSRQQVPSARSPPPSPTNKQRARSNSPTTTTTASSGSANANAQLSQLPHDQLLLFTQQLLASVHTAVAIQQQFPGSSATNSGPTHHIVGDRSRNSGSSTSSFGGGNAIQPSALAPFSHLPGAVQQHLTPSSGELGNHSSTSSSSQSAEGTPLSHTFAPRDLSKHYTSTNSPFKGLSAEGTPMSRALSPHGSGKQHSSASSLFKGEGTPLSNPFAPPQDLSKRSPVNLDMHQETSFYKGLSAEGTPMSHTFSPYDPSKGRNESASLSPALQALPSYNPTAHRDSTFSYLNSTCQSSVASEAGFEMYHSAKLDRENDFAGFETFNGLTILEELGAGASGKVMLAFDGMTNERRAIKLIPRRHAANRKDGEEVLREVAIMKKLHHGNLVRLYEVIDDPEEDTIYLVMQYIDSGPIVDLSIADCTCKPLTLSLLNTYVRQMIPALRYMHSRRVVHRDIKPDNILVSSDNHLYFADFGISSVLEIGATERIERQYGTPYFMAPEVVEGKKVTSAADMWSVGVTIYVMLFGHLPFIGRSYGETLTLICSGNLDFPPATPDKAKWKNLIKLLLEKNPQKRLTAYGMSKMPMFAPTARFVVPESTASTGDRGGGRRLSHITLTRPSGSDLKRMDNNEHSDRTQELLPEEPIVLEEEEDHEGGSRAVVQEATPEIALSPFAPTLSPSPSARRTSKGAGEDEKGERGDGLLADFSAFQTGNAMEDSMMIDPNDFNPTAEETQGAITRRQSYVPSRKGSMAHISRSSTMTRQIRYGESQSVSPAMLSRTSSVISKTSPQSATPVGTMSRRKQTPTTSQSTGRRGDNGTSMDLQILAEMLGVGDCAETFDEQGALPATHVLSFGSPPPVSPPGGIPTKGGMPNHSAGNSSISSLPGSEAFYASLPTSTLASTTCSPKEPTLASV